MPRGDGTGPLGLGPMTGRVAGFCAGFRVPGYMNPVGRFAMRTFGYGLFALTRRHPLGIFGFANKRPLGLGLRRGAGWRR